MLIVIKVTFVFVIIVCAVIIVVVIYPTHTISEETNTKRTLVRHEQGCFELIIHKVTFPLDVNGKSRES